MVITEELKTFIIYFVLVLSTVIVIGLFFLYEEIHEIANDVDQAIKGVDKGQQISMKNQELMKIIISEHSNMNTTH